LFDFYQSKNQSAEIKKSRQAVPDPVEMDLAVDDDHWLFLFRNVAKCSRKARPNATLK
jgi:hypothetical protein